MYKVVISAACPECDYSSSKGGKAIEAILTINEDVPEVEQLLSEEKIVDYLRLCHHQSSPECEGVLNIDKRYVS